MTTENANAPGQQRESIWSVPLEYRVFYFALFVIQSLIGMSYVVWHEVWINDADSFHSTATAIVLMDVAVIAHSAGIGVIVSEMKMVIAQYLEQRYYGPKRRKALAEAKAEGGKESQRQGPRMERAPPRSPSPRRAIRRAAADRRRARRVERKERTEW